jgi:sugar lactone lactonase YvrE
MHLHIHNTLGEGPIWHAKRGSVFWVDIEEKLLYEYQLKSKKCNHWAFESRIGTVAIDKNDNLLIALQGKIVLFNLATFETQIFCNLEPDIANNRPNDGKVAPDGRLWQGTMDMACKEEAGSLYCIDSQVNISQKLSNLSISNGMAWSLDLQYFYHIDSPSQQVKQYFFDKVTSEIVFNKIAIEIPYEYGYA